MATTQMLRPYFCYYVKNNVLYFRHEDGRNGGEPLNLKQETKEQAVQRLTVQLGLINPILEDLTFTPTTTPAITERSLSNGTR